MFKEFYFMLTPEERFRRLAGYAGYFGFFTFKDFDLEKSRILICNGFHPFTHYLERFIQTVTPKKIPICEVPRIYDVPDKIKEFNPNILITNARNNKAFAEELEKIDYQGLNFLHSMTADRFKTLEEVRANRLDGLILKPSGILQFLQVIGGLKKEDLMQMEFRTFK